MWRLFSRQVRRTLPTEIFPSGLQEGWQPATGLDCKLALAEVSPDDGAGEINIIHTLYFSIIKSRKFCITSSISYLILLSSILNTVIPNEIKNSSLHRSYSSLLL